jgi:uncharacterized phage protein (TIGR01671 family)
MTPNRKYRVWCYSENRFVEYVVLCPDGTLADYRGKKMNQDDYEVQFYKEIKNGFGVYEGDVVQLTYDERHMIMGAIPDFMQNQFNPTKTETVLITEIETAKNRIEKMTFGARVIETNPVVIGNIHQNPELIK